MPVAHPAVPSLVEAQNALAQLDTDDALTHLEAALRSLRNLSLSLQKGDRLEPSEQRHLERSLLRFRSELRNAGVLAECGLAYCQDWSQQLQPPSAYEANGAFAGKSAARPELSVEA